MGATIPATKNWTVTRLPVAIKVERYHLKSLIYSSTYYSLGLYIATCATLLLLLCLIVCAMRLRLVFNPHPSQLNSQAWKLAFLNQAIHASHEDLGRSLFVLNSHLFYCCLYNNILL